MTKTIALREKISEDLKTAMKTGQSPLVKTLRFIQAGIKNKEIELRAKPLTESELIAVLRKLMAQAEESVEHYKTAGYKKQTEAEEFQLSVLKSYLPKPLSSDELKTLVEQSIKESGATSIKDMGQLMKLVLAKAKGKAPAKALSETVREALLKL